MQDIESDIAKLRMALNEIQNDSRVDAVAQNIEQLVNFLDGLKFDFTREDMGNMQHHIAHMAEELTDLSSRTNKLILTSEDSRSDIKNTVLRFEQFLSQIYNNIKPIADAKGDGELGKKINNIDKQLAKLNKSIEKVTSYVDEE